jgi:2-oxoglutarate ferredoxin oxidoreductase subunit alpha
MIRFLQGNEACAEGALAAGMRFFAGYPITPSSEIAEHFSKRLPQLGGKFIQMEDEIASMGAIIGASMGGLKVMTATSGPGFSLKQELIGFACLCEIPIVIVNVQRGGPSTGLPTSPAQQDVMQARWGTHGDHSIIVFCPFSVKESFDLTVTAFNLSEKLRTPVILLSDEVIAHMREKVEMPNIKNLKIINREKPSKSPAEYNPYEVENMEDVPKIANFGDGYRFNITGLIHDKTGFPTNSPKETEFLLKRLERKIESRRSEIVFTDERFIEDCDTLVFAYGASARVALGVVKEARRKGKKVGFFRPITLWPFPDDKLKEAAKTVKKIIVVEMNLGQMIREVQRCICGVKIEGVLVANGRLISPNMIWEKI